MTDLMIRKAQVGDVSSIVQIEEQSFGTPWSENAIRQEIVENENAFYIVAEIDGIVVGYAGIWLILDEGHITNVAVHPGYRRRHVGSAIMAVLIAVTEQEGIFHHTLEVRSENTAAIRLYENLGFHSSGVRKGYYSDTGEDALIMWRSISKTPLN